jgi:hypothetical protein
MSEWIVNCKSSTGVYRLFGQNRSVWIMRSVQQCLDCEGSTGVCGLWGQYMCVWIGNCKGRTVVYRFLGQYRSVQIVRTVQYRRVWIVRAVQECMDCEGNMYKL